MACRTVMQEEIIRKGPWLEEEDERLATFVTLLGQGRWDFVARVSGLKRTGKSCRLRWMNYLHPDLIHGRISAEEELIILELHERWGNKWSSIARRLPGRTDNEIKNYWRTYLRKKAHAQELENLQREIDNAMHSTKGYLIKEGDASTQTTSSDHSEHVKEDLCEISEESFNTFGFSNQSFANSPYETRLSDWMEGLPNDQTTFKHECSSLDYGNGDSLWDYSSGSLWNME